MGTSRQRGIGLLSGLTVVLVGSPVFVFAWAFGGLRGDVLRLVMPVVTVICACGLLLPQRHPDESAGEALKRMWGQIVRDPFFWTSVVLIAYLFVPLFNVGRSPLSLVAGNAASSGMLPRWPYLPFCVSATEHLGVVWWFVPTLVSALGIRFALVRTGKRVLYEAFVWNGFLLALLGFAQLVTRAQAPFWGATALKVHFFSAFAYPNMAGAFFVLTYALALGLWVFQIGKVEDAPLSTEFGRHAEPPSKLRAHYPLIPVAVLLCAVLATYSRAAISLAVLLSVLFVIYVLFRPLAVHGVERARRFKTVFVVDGLLLILLAVIYVYAPPELGREMRTLNVFSVSDRVTGKGQYHTRAATDIMRTYPLFGVGGWGYRHFSRDYLRRLDDEGSLQKVGGANVHNDYLQFLVEHGAVGFILMAMCLSLLAKPGLMTWHHLVKLENARARSGMGASSLAIYSVEAPVLWIFLGSIAVLIHAFGDCPLRAASVLSLLYAVQAVSSGFLPHDS